MLEASILGLDHYIQEQKKGELQILAKKEKGVIIKDENIRFLKNSEALKFMNAKAGQLIKYH